MVRGRDRWWRSVSAGSDSSVRRAMTARVTASVSGHGGVAGSAGAGAWASASGGPVRRVRPATEHRWGLISPAAVPRRTGPWRRGTARTEDARSANSCTVCVWLWKTAGAHVEMCTCLCTFSAVPTDGRGAVTRVVVRLCRSERISGATGLSHQDRARECTLWITLGITMWRSRRVVGITCGCFLESVDNSGRSRHTCWLSSNPARTAGAADGVESVRSALVSHTGATGDPPSRQGVRRPFPHDPRKNRDSMTCFGCAPTTRFRWRHAADSRIRERSSRPG